MANTDNPQGLVYKMGGNPAIVEVSVDASNSAAIGINDGYIIETDGSVARVAAGSGVILSGVAEGFKDSTGKSISYLPASTAGTIIAKKIDPSMIFEIQADSGTALTVAAVGATADLVVANCDTTTGVSKIELDSSNVGTGQQVRIIGISSAIGNAWGEHVKLLVQIAENTSISNASV
tara:strand:+ start:727 stop:1260 length:534 start_codon:yes stop_codon:yes gene_type:complete